MAKGANEEMSKIYELLSHYTFTIIDDSNNDYKCGICKKLIIDAHQTICGCNFCYECINQYTANGGINCPNNTEECRSESLSNFIPNYNLQKKIPKLIVRCPNKMCSHECQLKEMRNHLNSCSKKGVKCPFNDLGCGHDDLISDKLNDHMLSDIHSHNKMLIDLIGNLRNEMRELNEKVEVNKLEIKVLKENAQRKDEIIELLKENDRKKDELIESIKEEIQLTKQKNDDLRQQMEICNRNLWYKLDEIDDEMKEKCKNDSINDEIKLMRAERKEMEQQIKIVQKNIGEKYDTEMNARLREIKRLNTKLENIKDKIKDEMERYPAQITNEIKRIDKYLNMRDNGELQWQIGEINKINLMLSEYFFDKENPYKMYLQLENTNNELNIWLQICSGGFDDDLKWPCRAAVRIYISSLNDEYHYKSTTKSCKIEKPRHLFARSDLIKISHSDLAKTNLINIDCKLRFYVKFL